MTRIKITNKKTETRPNAQTSWIGRRTANRVVIGGLTHKQSSNVPRAFPPENQILHTFVKIYQLHLRLSTDESTAPWLYKASLNGTFDFAPMILCIEE